MEKLLYRQATEAVRMRLDWKYALHLPLADAGFDFSVLSEFRDRLIAGRAEARVFELVRAIRELGLIKKRGKQRTDSLAMLTRPKLKRLKLVVEMVRVAIVELVTINRVWSQSALPPSWEAKYGEEFVMQRYREK